MYLHLMADKTWHIRLNDDDERNIEIIRKRMLKMGLPESAVKTAAVVRFAMKFAAETK